MRKWPGLAAEVANITDANSNFFLHLPLHGLFEGLARLHETRQDAIHPRGVCRERASNSLSPHVLAQPRTTAVGTAEAHTGNTFWHAHRAARPCARRTNRRLVCPIPLDDLKGPAHQPKFSSSTIIAERRSLKAMPAGALSVESCAA